MGMMKNIKNSIFDLVEMLIMCSLIISLVYIFVGQLLEVDGNSMYPTYLNGERLVAEKISLRYKEISRGEVVVFQHPDIPEKHLLIKRVIALPGETFEMKNGLVYINGQKLEEPYLQSSTVTQEISGGIYKEGVKYTLDNNSYVLLGDNRGQSTDSRYFGPVNKDKIIGRVVLVYHPLNRFRLLERY
jgi:signal peptidase I